MKNNVFILCIFHLLTIDLTFGQTPRLLQGRVIDTETGNGVKNITVYSSFDRNVTDNSGRYSLDLSKCKDCTRGRTIFVSTYNEEFGLYQVHFALPSEQTQTETDIIIRRNSNITGISGIVKDKKTNKTLKNIKVRIRTDDNATVNDEIKTDEFGMYKFLLRKDKVGNIKYVNVFFEDPEERYLSNHETRNIATSIESFLEPSVAPAFEIEINGYEKTNIKIYPGNLIRIRASGNIRLGPWVGSSDPDGVASGVANVSLENYNISRNIRHGALLYKITGDDDWRFSGKEIEFTAQKEGFLEFQINDKDSANNSGAYKARVTVIK